MRNVAGVAVKEERDQPRVRTRHPPSVQLDAIGRLHPDVDGVHLRLRIPKSFGKFGRIVDRAISEIIQTAARGHEHDRPSDVKGNARQAANVAWVATAAYV